MDSQKTGFADGVDSTERIDYIFKNVFRGRRLLDTTSGPKLRNWETRGRFKS